MLQRTPRSSFPAGAGRDRASVGVVTYSNQVHFYRLKPGGAAFSIVSMPDMTDVYIPPGSGFVAPLSECEATVKAVLSELPELHSHSNGSLSLSGSGDATCAGAAILAAIRAIQPRGGHVHAFVARRPTEVRLLVCWTSAWSPAWHSLLRRKRGDCGGPRRHASLVSGVLGVAWYGKRELLNVCRGR